MEKTIKAHAYFPIEWAFGKNQSDGRQGPPPDDPMTIYFVEEIDGNDPDWQWEFTLTDLIQTFLDGSYAEHGRMEEAHIPSAVALRDGLRKLADQLDAAIKNV